MLTNLTWTIDAGASPAPASWADLERMLTAKATPTSADEGPEPGRAGEFGPVKTRVLELVEGRDGMTAAEVRSALPEYSMERIHASLSQLARVKRVARDRSSAGFVYRRRVAPV